jgi:hypothetical protein
MKLDFITAFYEPNPPLYIATAMCACLGSGTLFDALQIRL